MSNPERIPGGALKEFLEELLINYWRNFSVIALGTPQKFLEKPWRKFERISDGAPQGVSRNYWMKCREIGRGTREITE